MSQEPPKRAAWFRYTDAASIGMEIAIAITLGALGGFYLEKHVTHWSPWTTLIGLAVGILAAVKALVRTARNFKRELASRALVDRAEVDAKARTIEDDADESSR